MNLTKRFDDSVHASVQELITDDVKNVVRIKKWHTRRQPTVPLMLLPHFDVFCDLLLSRQKATGNLSFLFYKGRKQSNNNNNNNDDDDNNNNNKYNNDKDKDKNNDNDNDNDNCNNNYIYIALISFAQGAIIYI